MMRVCIECTHGSIREVNEEEGGGETKERMCRKEKTKEKEKSGQKVSRE